MGSHILQLKAGVGSQEISAINLSAWLFLPTEKPKALIVCLAGGSYSKSYYHSVFPGHDGYSFGEDLAQKSFAVLVVDHPGMGASDCPENAGLLTRQAVADLHQSALSGFLDRAKAGEWEFAFDDIAHIGVGHSLGAMVLTQWQASHRVFDKVVFLGWTNTGLSFDTSQLPEPEKIPAYLPVDRAMMRPIFHLPDVPLSLIDLDDKDASLTPSPLGHDGVSPGIVREQAGEISCPVFTCFGEVDVSPDPWAEVAHFKSSRDITLLRLENSAHNHNFSTDRHRLWAALAHWVVGA